MSECWFSFRACRVWIRAARLRGKPASQRASPRSYRPASRPECYISIIAHSLSCPIPRPLSLSHAHRTEGLQSHSLSPHLSIAISVNHDSSFSASGTTICSVSAGSGCGSESRRDTIVGFALLGEKALEDALMGRGIGIGIGEAWMVVVRVRRVVRRRVGACMIVW